ncbi:unnamed protein product [Protopolystoma xenopodis]|uniref:Uncharacterized protein n=1 Tax=Protopolystoma xenopodis TaxID=117903 RepID=A0A3S5BTF7_9PLAT|nr:unnamed protein product [Protopolystoma xenopodis]
MTDLRHEITSVGSPRGDRQPPTMTAWQADLDSLSSRGHVLPRQASRMSFASEATLPVALTSEQTSHSAAPAAPELRDEVRLAETPAAMTPQPDCANSAELATVGRLEDCAGGCSVARPFQVPKIFTTGPPLKYWSRGTDEDDAQGILNAIPFEQRTTVLSILTQMSATRDPLMRSLDSQAVWIADLRGKALLTPYSMRAELAAVT